jgi:hypothetical protein
VKEVFLPLEFPSCHLGSPGVLGRGKAKWILLIPLLSWLILPTFEKRSVSSGQHIQAKLRGIDIWSHPGAVIKGIRELPPDRCNRDSCVAVR